MNNKLYKNYVDDIAYYLKQEKRPKLAQAIGSYRMNEGVSNTPTMQWHDKIKNEANFRSLSALNTIAGNNVKYEEKLGAHPSFLHLKHGDKSEYHYIVSMFIDIKNSTGLFKKYDPIVVANICRTIQLAAIHTCWYFDAYIHRLQGDGLMVYFGGKQTDKKKAVENALMAGSFISYFVKNDLKDLFEEKGVNRIYTRIGIDFGDADTTLWHNAGVGECSEITTTSLHTSLASKMQSQAESNGIVVGDNIIAFKSSSENLFSHKTYSENGIEKNFIYEIPEEKFRYKQHDFHWEKYLKNHPLIGEDNDGSLTFKGVPVVSSSHIHNNIQHLQRNVSDYKPYFK